MRDLQNIPAEILGDYVVKHARHDELFQIAKRLEHYAFSKSLPAFDGLGLDEKSLLGALLDFTAVDRSKFASAWTKALPAQAANNAAQADVGPLFAAGTEGDNKQKES